MANRANCVNFFVNCLHLSGLSKTGGSSLFFFYYESEKFFEFIVELNIKSLSISDDSAQTPPLTDRVVEANNYRLAMDINRLFRYHQIHRIPLKGS